MDWDDLTTFAAVAEELSFTAAAKRLRTSKGVVSQRVGRLEGRLGFVLHDRTTARVSLTDRGHRTLDWVQRTVDSWSRCTRSC